MVQEKVSAQEFARTAGSIVARLTGTQLLLDIFNDILPLADSTTGRRLLKSSAGRIETPRIRENELMAARSAVLAALSRVDQDRFLIESLSGHEDLHVVLNDSAFNKELALLTDGAASYARVLLSQCATVSSLKVKEQARDGLAERAALSKLLERAKEAELTHRAILEQVSLRDAENGRDEAYAFWCGGDLDSAIASLKRLRRIGLATVQDQYDLACLYLSGRRALDATGPLIAALEAEDENRTVRAALADAHLRSGNFPDCIAVAETAVAEVGVDGRMAELLAFAHGGSAGMFGNLWSMRPTADESVRMVREWLDVAISADSANHRRTYRAARFLLHLQFYDDALKLLRNLIDEQPESHSVFTAYAIAVEYGGRTGKGDTKGDASIWYERAAALPDDRFDVEPLFFPLESDLRLPRPPIPRVRSLPHTLLRIPGVAIAY